MNKNTMKLNITLTMSFIFFKCAFKLKRHVHFECQLYFSLCKREIQSWTHFSTALCVPALVYYDGVFYDLPGICVCDKTSECVNQNTEGP